MSRSIRYVALYENDTVTQLGRIVEDNNGLWGEVFHEGQWIKYEGVLYAIFSPGSFADVISYEEATKIARDLGITIAHC